MYRVYVITNFTRLWDPSSYYIINVLNKFELMYEFIWNYIPLSFKGSEYLTHHGQFHSYVNYVPSYISFKNIIKMSPFLKVRNCLKVL